MMPFLLLGLALAAPDRSAPPPTAPATLITLPHMQGPLSSDKTPAEWLPIAGVSRVAVVVRLPVGRLALGLDQSAATDSLESLWGVATANNSREALAERLRRLDANIDLDIGARATTITLDAPRAVWLEALDLLDDVIQKPIFPAKDLRTDTYDTVRFWQIAASHDAGTVADLALDYAWYPTDHLFGAPPDLRAIKRVSVRDLEAVHAQIIAHPPERVLIVGDVEPDNALPEVQQFIGHIAHTQAPELESPDLTDKSYILAIDVPGTELASIRYRAPAPGYRSSDMLAFDGIEFALGGPFLARLNRNLREDKGWTYGVHTSWDRAMSYGTWTVSVEVPADKASDAISEIRTEITTFLEHGPTPAELAAWRTARVRDHNGVLLTASSAASTFDHLRAIDWTIDDLTASIGKIDTIGASEFQGIGRVWLAPEHAILVVAGDRAKLESELAASALPVRWIDADDAVLGTFERKAP